jgi:hypothetical protein
MEEETCPGEAIGQINDVFEGNMLLGDKSLIGNVIKERDNEHEQPFNIKKEKFQETRKPIEERKIYVIWRNKKIPI